MLPVLLVFNTVPVIWLSLVLMVLEEHFYCCPGNKDCHEVTQHTPKGLKLNIHLGNCKTCSTVTSLQAIP